MVRGTRKSTVGQAATAPAKREHPDTDPTTPPAKRRRGRPLSNFTQTSSASRNLLEKTALSFAPSSVSTSNSDGAAGLDAEVPVAARPPGADKEIWAAFSRKVMRSDSILHRESEDDCNSEFSPRLAEKLSGDVVGDGLLTPDSSPPASEHSGELSAGRDDDGDFSDHSNDGHETTQENSFSDETSDVSPSRHVDSGRGKSIDEAAVTAAHILLSLNANSRALKASLRKEVQCKRGVEQQENSLLALPTPRMSAFPSRNGSPVSDTMLDQMFDQADKVHSVYHCQFPGCAYVCTSLQIITEHISSVHMETPVTSPSTLSPFYTEMLVCEDVCSPNLSTPSTYAAATPNLANMAVHQQSTACPSKATPLNFYPGWQSSPWPTVLRYQQSASATGVIAPSSANNFILPPVLTTALPTPQLPSVPHGLTFLSSVVTSQADKVSPGAASPETVPVNNVNRHPALSAKKETVTKSRRESPDRLTAVQKLRGDGRKCRKVYGMEQKKLWCTQCQWKKACTRFTD